MIKIVSGKLNSHKSIVAEASDIQNKAFIDEIESILGDDKEKRTSQPLAIQSKNSCLVELEIVQLRLEGLSIDTIAKKVRKKVAFVNNAIKFAKTNGLAVHQEEAQAIPTPVKIERKHLAFITMLIRTHSDNITVRRIRQTLSDVFVELKNVAARTVFYAVKRKLGLTKKKALLRNKRIGSPNRKKQILHFLREISQAITTGRDTYSIDECALWVGKEEIKRWHLRSESVVVIENTDQAPRITALCAFSRSGRHFILLIWGACTGLI